MNEPTEAGAALLQKIAGTAQVAGPVVTVGSATKQYFGYSLDEWSLIGILAGIALGALGYITGTAVSIYFKAQHLRLARETANASEDE